jgi:hypothetical protein
MEISMMPGREMATQLGKNDLVTTSMDYFIDLMKAISRTHTRYAIDSIDLYYFAICSS